MLAGIIFLAGAAAFQSEVARGIAEGEHLFMKDNLAFVTSDPTARDIEGKFMVHIDGVWRDIRFEPRVMPAD